MSSYLLVLADALDRNSNPRQILDIGALKQHNHLRPPPQKLTALKQHRPTSTMTVYGSLLELVKGCNPVVDNDTATKHWEPASSGRAVAQRELTKFVLRNDNGERQTFGYLTSDVVDDLPWEKSGVQKVARESAWKEGNTRTCGFQEDANIKRLNDRVTCMTNRHAVRQNSPL